MGVLSTNFRAEMRHGVWGGVATLNKKYTKMAFDASGKHGHPRSHFSTCALFLGQPVKVSQSWGSFGGMRKVEGGPLLTERNLP